MCYCKAHLVFPQSFRGGGGSLSRLLPRLLGPRGFGALEALQVFREGLRHEAEPPLPWLPHREALEREEDLPQAFGVPEDDGERGQDQGRVQGEEASEEDQAPQEEEGVEAPAPEVEDGGLLEPPVDAFLVRGARASEVLLEEVRRLVLEAVPGGGAREVEEGGEEEGEGEKSGPGLERDPLRWRRSSPPFAVYCLP